MRPWLEEPDEVRGSHAGLEWLVRRAGGGHLCGYVRVPGEHPLYGAPLYAAQDDDDYAKYWFGKVEVHGCPTYAGFRHEDGGFWVGFDCAHSGDLSPNYRGIVFEGTYRTMGYVLTEVLNLAEQVAAGVPAK